MAVNLHYYALNENGSFTHANDAGSYHDTLDEYEYDAFNLVVLGVLGSAVNISGIVLTILILIALSRMHPKSASMILLVGVGYSDLVILFLGQILVFIPRAFGYLESMISYVAFVEVDYRYLYPIKDMALIINAWFLVALAAERYIVIVHPAHRSRLLARRRILLLVGVIVTSAFVFDVPKFFEYHTITHHDVSPHDRQIRIEGSKLHGNKAFMWVYMFALDLLVRLFIPSVLLVVFSVLNLKGLKRFKESHATSSMKDKAKAEMTARVTLIVLALTGSFILIQIPYVILALLHLCHDESTPHPFYAKLVNAALFFQAVNSAIKFYLYFGLSKNFRFELRKNCCCCREEEEEEGEEGEGGNRTKSSSGIEVVVEEIAPIKERGLSTIEE